MSERSSTRDFRWNVRYHMTDGPRMTSRRVHNSSVSDNPTFPEFVDYLIRTPPNLMDKHWAPYTKVGHSTFVSL